MRPMQVKTAKKQSSIGLSLLVSSALRTLACNVIGGWRRDLLRLDCAYLGKGFRRFFPLSLGARDQGKLIVCGGVLVMTQRQQQHFLGAWVVLFDGIRAAQLPIGRPQIGLAADCRLEMRNRLWSALLGHQNGPQFCVGFWMAWAEFQFAGEFRGCMVRIAVLPVEVPKPEMNSG